MLREEVGRLEGIYRAALYCRLSREDGEDVGEGKIARHVGMGDGAGAMDAAAVGGIADEGFGAVVFGASYRLYAGGGGQRDRARAALGDGFRV